MKPRIENNHNAPKRTPRRPRRHRKLCRQRSELSAPILRFTPTAWAKLHLFCHHGETEIGGFGLTSADDLLLVEEFATVKQVASAVSIAFDDAAVADFFEEQVDAGRKPQQFARIWAHTHPGESPVPSSIDEETFARVFGGCDWAVMFVLARGGATYCRLRFNVGPGGQVLIPVSMDYARPFAGSDHDAWKSEYERNVRIETLAWGLGKRDTSRPTRRLLDDLAALPAEEDGDWPDAFLTGFEDEPSALTEKTDFDECFCDEDEVYA